MVSMGSSFIKQLFLSLLLLFIVTLLLSCTSLIFQPINAHRFDIAKAGIEYENVNFSSSDGTQLHGWWLPHSQSEYKSTIVFLHGNAGNVSYHLAYVYWLTQHGYDVFIFDYRGYGLSTGEEQLPDLFDDIEAAFSYTRQRVIGNKFVVIGHSLGASLGVKAIEQSSMKADIQAYVMVSGFSDYHKIAKDILSKSWLTWIIQWPLSFTINNDYRPLDAVSNISPIPLIIAHSQQDEIIPYYHGQDLYILAKEPKSFLLMMGRHNTILLESMNRKKLIESLNTVIKIAK